NSGHGLVFQLHNYPIPPTQFHMSRSDNIPAPQALRFVVRGRVQGVGFRWFVEREAHMLGVFGWVRNNADGSVEVLAMGTREQLSGLRSRLQQGPRAARVDAVEEKEAQPVAGLKTFRIEGAW
ncbi:MAG TPA: acylphosphatase, partial [Terriglobales bacterium]|nr:acylphosphatase [Terriglobales bacterium]